MAYLGSEDTPLAKIHWDFIRLALSSVARLAVIPVQDYLGLGSEARVNEPSTLGKNWRWRMLPGEITVDKKEFLTDITERYNRGNK